MAARKEEPTPAEQETAKLIQTALRERITVLELNLRRELTFVTPPAEGAVYNSGPSPYTPVNAGAAMFGPWSLRAAHGYLTPGPEDCLATAIEQAEFRCSTFPSQIICYANWLIEQAEEINSYRDLIEPTDA